MIKTKLIVRAIAFSGTSNEMSFSEEVLKFDELEIAQQNVFSLAKAHEALNVMAARFSAIEEAQGKKLTTPQKKLIELAFELENTDARLPSNTTPSNTKATDAIDEITPSESSVDIGGAVPSDGEGDKWTRPSDESQATFDTPDGQGSPILTDSGDSLNDSAAQDKSVAKVVNDTPEVEDEPQPEADPLLDAVSAATPPEQAEGVEAALAALGL